jgi:predicted transcriptional regulator
MGTSKARKRAVVIEDEVNISARVPREMKAAVIDLAKSRDRSASAEVRLALKAWLDDEERGVAA